PFASAPNSKPRLSRFAPIRSGSTRFLPKPDIERAPPADLPGQLLPLLESTDRSLRHGLHSVDSNPADRAIPAASSLKDGRCSCRRTETTVPRQDLQEPATRSLVSDCYRRLESTCRERRPPNALPNTGIAFPAARAN